MIMKYIQNVDIPEEEVLKDMKDDSLMGEIPNDEAFISSPNQIQEWLDANKVDYISSITEPIDIETLNIEEFITSNLKQNYPIMVEWLAYAGHWTVIIGYDSNNCDELCNHTLIMADPFAYGCNPEVGYHIVSVDQFLCMWRDCDILPPEQRYFNYFIIKDYH